MQYAQKDSNLRLLPCESSALPLSYARKDRAMDFMAQHVSELVGGVLSSGFPPG